MILLGLIVMLIGAGLGGATLLASRGAVEAVTLSVFGFSRETGPLELLAVGALSGFATCLGLALIVGALRGRAHRRSEEELEDRIDELEEIHEDELDRIRTAVAEAKLKDADFARREQAMKERAAQIEARERELGLRTGPPAAREHAPRPPEAGTERSSGPATGPSPSPSYDRPPTGAYDGPPTGAYDGPPTGAYDGPSTGAYGRPGPSAYDQEAGPYDQRPSGGDTSAWPEPTAPRHVPRRRRSGV